MSGGHDHQDWNTVVFHKKAKQPDAGAEAVHKDHGRQDRERARKIDEETAVLFKLSVAMRKIMMDARTKKNLTREQLAHRLNVKPKVIIDMESGVVMQDPSILPKVKRELGVTELRFGA